MSSPPKRRVEQKPLVAEDDSDFEEEEDEGEGDDEFIEEHEEELEKVLTEDIYSLLYTAPLCGLTYIFATFIFLLQAGLLLLIFIDLVDYSSDPNQTNGKSNRLDLPGGAEVEVTIAQFVGICLIILLSASDGDCIKGVMQLAEGYNPSIMHGSPNASCLRWLVTGLLQTAVGLLLLVLSFVLFMQSTTVIDLTLNLTGLHFLQEVDDMGFKLASQGLISKRTQEDCKHVADLNREPTPEAVKQKSKVTKRILIVLIGIALLVPYFTVVSWQFHGRFLCHTLYVQFGDTFFPDMGYYSGTFQSQGDWFSDRKDGRPVYMDETGSIMLAYCRSERAWCFSYETDNPCDYFMKSSETENFDLIEVTADGWFVKTDSAGDVPVDWLAVVCYDCNKEVCKGECRENKCECNETEGLGFNCEFEMPTCEAYRLDFRTKGSLASFPEARLLLDTRFTGLTGYGFMSKDDPILTMQGRLWYIPDVETEEAKGSYYVNTFMIFTGRRWEIFSVSPDETPPYTFVEFHEKVRAVTINNSSASNVDRLRTIYRSEDFASYAPVFFSTPVDWGTESYGVEPLDVQWVLASSKEEDNLARSVSDYQADDDSPVSARFLCAHCTPNNDDEQRSSSKPNNDTARPCYNNGVCNNEGQCLCTSFYDGSRCEHARSCVNDNDCYHGGICDMTTNICICAENTDDAAAGLTRKGSNYFGLLCQNPNTIQDPFFCSRNENSCRGAGDCNGFEERCDCYAGYEGDNCEVALSP